ncbi:MAG: hypothetical protein IKP32_06740 [Clostridia bacterium]|nr:hypothetical protein [Clostridia bacterium]
MKRFFCLLCALLVMLGAVCAQAEDVSESASADPAEETVEVQADPQPVSIAPPLCFMDQYSFGMALKDALDVTGLENADAWGWAQDTQVNGIHLEEPFMAVELYFFGMNDAARLQEILYIFHSVRMAARVSAVPELKPLLEQFQPEPGDWEDDYTAIEDQLDQWVETAFPSAMDDEGNPFVYEVEQAVLPSFALQEGLGERPVRICFRFVPVEDGIIVVYHGMLATVNDHVGPNFVLYQWINTDQINDFWAQIDAGNGDFLNLIVPATTK